MHDPTHATKCALADVLLEAVLAPVVVMRYSGHYCAELALAIYYSY